MANRREFLVAAVTTSGVSKLLVGKALPQQSPARGEPQSIKGEWRFALDPNKEGVEKQFFNQGLPERITLPGSTDEAKFGTPNPDKPTLDGLYRLYTYEGPAWYQRDIEIPQAWKGKQVSLFLERTHWVRPFGWTTSCRHSGQPDRPAPLRPREQPRAGQTPVDNPRGQHPQDRPRALRLH